MTVIATGPSLTAADCEQVRQAGIETIAVNDAYRLAPFASHLYACDAKWWNVHDQAVRQTFTGRLWSQQEQNGTEFVNPSGITILESKEGTGLAKGALIRGANSGYQAINLAYQLGADLVLLLGFDMCGTGTHFFGLHPPGLIQHTAYEQFIGAFTKMRPDFYGLEVINCSRRTALHCFKQQTINEAIAAL